MSESPRFMSGICGFMVGAGVPETSQVVNEAGIRPKGQGYRLRFL